MNELWHRIRTAWDNFSPRERLLLSVAGGVLVLALAWGVLVSPLFAAIDRAGERVETAEQQYAAMQRLRREYDQVDARLAAVEQRIRDNRDQRNILTLLENLAARSSVKIDSMEERQSGSSDSYKETKVEVELKNVTLTQVVNYLHNIESADRLFSVKSMRIKQRSDTSDLLDVTFTVSSFEPL